jgi:dsRNA-specific ribonuclease
MKDAAFYAYKALFQAGLLNDNLLPLTHESVLAEDQLNELPAVIEASAQFDPWKELAESWPSPNLHRIQVSVQEVGKGTENSLSMNLTVPSAIPSVPPFLLYWDEKTIFRLCFGEPGRPAMIGPDELHILREITHILDRSTHSDSTSGAPTDFIAIFSPGIPDEKLATWLTANRGRCEALEAFRKQESSPRGFVRTPLRYNAPYIFHRWKILRSEQADAALEVECLRLPRRRNFVAPATLSKNSTPSEESLLSPRLEAFPAESCTVDLLPTNVARFSLFIPAILQHIEVLSVAHQVCANVLKDVHITDVRHVVTAICAPSAQWIVNYQRYEFFGDAVLKYVVSWQLFCDHGNWPEGYLSVRRNRIVSNASLARAALKARLDASIIAELGKGRKWTPPLISEALSRSDEKRNMSAKVLADVVEALIGAAFFDGGICLARACMHTFLPISRIDAPDFDPAGQNLGIAVMEAESVIGYQFRSKALLVEALTHPSQDRDTSTESYQRLEFLGDAVLDYLIVSLFAQQKPEQSQGQMTNLKAALVNADILGFLCLEFSHGREIRSVQERPAGVFRERIGVEQIQLWKFIRHHSQDIANAQKRCLARYGKANREIRHLLDTNCSYPWVPFARLNLEKFYSDIIESILGAIFVDQKGELKECQRFIERIGLVPYARRVMLEGINVLHPKAVVEQISGSAEVRYIVEGEEGEVCTYRCSVAVDGVRIVEVKGCLTKGEAVVVAADVASKLLCGSK